MVYTLFVTELVSAFILAATLLYRYGDCYRNHIIVTLSVLTAWYFSFLIMFILPLDVTSTVYRQCLQDNGTAIIVAPQVSATNESTTPAPVPHKCQEPWVYVPDYVFPSLWRVVYWSSQCLTWLIMPMMQSYSKAGDFTVKGKLKSALVDNAIYYGSYLFICGILLIYIAVKPGVYLDGPKIKAIASSASNTWGLFLLILLLGYALVEVPRNLWNNSKKNYTLTYSYFKLAKLSTDKCEAEETIDEILDSLSAMQTAVGGAGAGGTVLSRHVETIAHKLPAPLRDRLGARAPPAQRAPPPAVKSLVNLHKKTIKALHTLQRTETQWQLTLERIFHLEDVAASARAPHARLQRALPAPHSRLRRLLYPPQAEWYWECVARPYFLKALAVCTGILSAAVVWSELTFFSKQPVLSLFAVVVNAAKGSYNFTAIVTLSTLMIGYMSYCAFSTVLKIRVLNLYYLAPHHQTNEYSLIFSGMLACRLTPALCLNFLSLVHLDSHVIKERVMETYYTQIMGHMDVVGIVAEGFNIYFPMLVAVLCAATYWSLGSRLLSAAGFQQFVGDDELAADLVDEGREIAKREKRKRIRAEEALSRRRGQTDRFGAYRARDAGDGAHTGLLLDTDADYYVSPSPPRLRGDGASGAGAGGPEAPYNRAHLSLEEELEARFGESTIPARTSVYRAPPRDLFDDV